jgi:hypothetical protein
LLGVVAGLMSLARTDGLLWLALTFLFALWRARVQDEQAGKSDRSPFQWTGFLRSSFMALIGFLLIMSPWYARNLSVFGTLMAPGGSRALWLDQYDQTFIYPPTLLTMKSFLALGWKEILSDRLSAFGINLQSGFAAHGGIILFPFILVGIFYYRKDQRVRLAGLAWLILLFVMTVLFPFAGARGAFFHAGAALQPMWWTMAPLGLESILVSLRKRGWGNDQNRVIFRSILVMITMILTVFVVYIRLFKLGWGEGEEKYRAVEGFLRENGIQQPDIVIVRNAPGYYLETGRSAISIPYGGEETILAVSRQFDARYLVIEPQAALQPIQSLFEDPIGHARFQYLGELDEIRIYRIDSQ